LFFLKFFLSLSLSFFYIISSFGFQVLLVFIRKHKNKTKMGSNPYVDGRNVFSWISMPSISLRMPCFTSPNSWWYLGNKFWSLNICLFMMRNIDLLTFFFNSSAAGCLTWLSVSLLGGN
jgi:hypothetical protein